MGLRERFYTACFVDDLTAVRTLCPQLGKEVILSTACGTSNWKTVVYLLRQPQVDPDARDCTGLTALQAACWLGFDHTMHLLLHSGRCDVNVEDRNGVSVLWLAYSRGKAARVKVLLAGERRVVVTPRDLAKIQWEDAWTNSSCPTAPLLEEYLARPLSTRRRVRREIGWNMWAALLCAQLVMLEVGCLLPLQPSTGGKGQVRVQHEADAAPKACEIQN